MFTPNTMGIQATPRCHSQLPVSGGNKMALESRYPFSDKSLVIRPRDEI